jgi:hypothetical protein
MNFPLLFFIILKINTNNELKNSLIIDNYH